MYGNTDAPLSFTNQKFDVWLVSLTVAYCCATRSGVAWGERRPIVGIFMSSGAREAQTHPSSPHPTHSQTNFAGDIKAVGYLATFVKAVELKVIFVTVRSETKYYDVHFQNIIL